jgi:hypothetical protein
MFVTGTPELSNAFPSSRLLLHEKNENYLHQGILARSGIGKKNTPVPSLPIFLRQIWDDERRLKRLKYWKEQESSYVPMFKLASILFMDKE